MTFLKTETYTIIKDNVLMGTFIITSGQFEKLSCTFHALVPLTADEMRIISRACDQMTTNGRFEPQHLDAALGPVVNQHYKP